VDILFPQWNIPADGGGFFVGSCIALFVFGFFYHLLLFLQEQSATKLRESVFPEAVHKAQDKYDFVF